MLPAGPLALVPGAVERAMSGWSLK